MSPCCDHNMTSIPGCDVVGGWTPRQCPPPRCRLVGWFFAPVNRWEAEPRNCEPVSTKVFCSPLFVLGHRGHTRNTEACTARHRLTDSARPQDVGVSFFGSHPLNMPPRDIHTLAPFFSPNHAPQKENHCRRDHRKACLSQDDEVHCTTVCG